MEEGEEGSHSTELLVFVRVPSILPNPLGIECFALGSFRYTKCVRRVLTALDNDSDFLASWIAFWFHADLRVLFFALEARFFGTAIVNLLSL